MINKNSKIFIAGHKGMVGSAILRRLKKLSYKKIFYQTRKQLDLTDQKKVHNYLKKIKPDAVILAAAKVGGIKINNIKRAEFIYENLSIQNNLIHGSFISGVKNLLFMSSSCCYPKLANQPMSEDQLLTGPLESTNETYALAKIAGMKMCESYSKQFNLNYKSLMPCNLFGPGDNYDLETSHFIPAIINKIHKAKINKEKSIILWGTGKPLRELMYVDDLANAVEFFLFKKFKDSFLNIGSGIEYSIYEYAKLVNKIIGINDLIFKFDKNKPDGTPRKILNSTKAINLGWKCRLSIEEGINLAYNSYLKSLSIK